MNDSTTTYSFSITQRARGIWLANWSEDRDGEEGWDAFSTLAAAKRWCADKIDRRRLPWEDNSLPGYWPMFYAQVQIPDGEAAPYE